MASTDPLIPHLFRTEYRKIVSVLVKTFGFGEIAIAEDIAIRTGNVAAHSREAAAGSIINPTAISVPSA